MMPVKVRAGVIAMPEVKIAARQASVPPSAGR